MSNRLNQSVPRREPHCRQGLTTRTFAAPQLLGAVVVLSAVLLSACTKNTPEEEIAGYNKRLGPDATYTGDYMIIRWPARPDRSVRQGAVTLKIPRDYLAELPVKKDGQGHIRWVDVIFALPGVTPWKAMPFAVKGAPSEQVEKVMKNLRSRVVVFLDRDGGGGRGFQEATRREGRTRHNFEPDGQFAGLDRFSPRRCSGPEIEPGETWDRFLKGKEADDDSPSNCRRDRLEQLLVSPPSTQEDDGVSMACTSSGCNVYFIAGQRGATVFLQHEDVVRWKEFVEPARRLVDSFVIADPNSSTSAPSNQTR